MLLRPLAFCLALAALAASPTLVANAQVSEQGFPLIQSFDLGSVSRSPQTFSVAQDARGLVFVGGLGGVMVYDGARWDKAANASSSAVFAVAATPGKTAAEAGPLGAGGVDDFGTFELGPDGDLVYHSLVQDLPPEQRAVGDVRSIIATPKGLLFVADRRIFLWQNGRLLGLSEHSEDGPRPTAHRVGDAVYVWLPQGLFELNGEQLQLAPGGESLAGRRVEAMLPAEAGAIIAVESEGLFHWLSGQLREFSPEASRWVAEKGVSAACRLPDRRYALGSKRGGLLLVTESGLVSQRIDTSLGLPDDVVTGLAVDREGALWIALNNGLVRIEVSSPLSIIDARAGLKGRAHDVARHQGRLWVATSIGLFASALAEGPLRLELVAGLKAAPVWSLLSLGDELAVGTGNGVYLVSAAGIRHLEGGDGETVYLMRRSKLWPDRVWLGLRSGLSLLRRDPGEWAWGGKIAGVPRYIRSVVERPGGVVWAASTFDGLVKLQTGGLDPLSHPPRVTLTSGVDGVHFDAQMIESSGRILSARDDQMYRLDEASGKLVADSALADLRGYGFAFQMAEDKSGNLWINSDPPWVVVNPWQPGQTEVRSLVPFPARDLQSMVPDEAGVMWLLTEQGLLRHSGNLAAQAMAPPPPQVRKASLAGEPVPLVTAGLTAIALPPNPRRLRIEFAPLSYRSGLRYQTRLDPLDDEWSPPAEEPSTEIARLPAGAYTFRVRSLGPNRQQSPEAGWSFAVRAPWYATAWAIALWTLLGIALVRAWVVLRSRALAQRAAWLESQVTTKTEELRQVIAELSSTQAEVQNKNRLLESANWRLEELSFSDPLTGLANRRRLDVALAGEWSRAERHRLPVALVLVDLDHFKQLNDSRGHRDGDAALRKVAEVLARHAQRVGDVAARWGGEELALLLPGTTCPGAAEVAERVRQEIAALALPRDREGHSLLTASFGVAAVVPQPEDRLEALIEAADAALYRAKNAGRNRVEAA